VKPARAIAMAPANSALTRVQLRQVYSSNIIEMLGKGLESRTIVFDYGGVAQHYGALGNQRITAAARAVPVTQSPAVRHDDVIRHKVTMLRHLVPVAASQTAKEANLAQRFPDTPPPQIACRCEKTFTRQQDHTLRSHSSCISASHVSFNNGAADNVSGR
jgi:hypothetical protein